MPTSGFLGGSARDGENAALADRAPVAEPVLGTVALVGEKNLESEADQNYAEVERLLARLGLRGYGVVLLDSDAARDGGVFYSAG